MSRILATISCHESAILDIVNNDEKIVFNIFANPHKKQMSRNDKMIFKQSLAHAEKKILSKTPFLAFSKGQSKEFIVSDLKIKADLYFVRIEVALSLRMVRYDSQSSLCSL